MCITLKWKLIDSLKVEGRIWPLQIAIFSKKAEIQGSNVKKKKNIQKIQYVHRSTVPLLPRLTPVLALDRDFGGEQAFKDGRWPATRSLVRASQRGGGGWATERPPLQGSAAAPAYVFVVVGDGGGHAATRRHVRKLVIFFSISASRAISDRPRGNGRCGGPSKFGTLPDVVPSWTSAAFNLCLMRLRCPRPRHHPPDHHHSKHFRPQSPFIDGALWAVHCVVRLRNSKLISVPAAGA